MAVLIGFRHAKGDRSRGALKSVPQIDENFGVAVLAACVKLAASSGAFGPAAYPAEDSLKEVAELTPSGSI